LYAAADLKCPYTSFNGKPKASANPARSEYRAIGVNVPHLSQGYMGTWFHWRRIHGTREKMRQAIVEAILDAERHNMAFIRFCIGTLQTDWQSVLHLPRQETLL